MEILILYIYIIYKEYVVYLGFNVKSFYSGFSTTSALQSRFQMPSFCSSFNYDPLKRTSFIPYSSISTSYSGSSLFSKISFLDELSSKYSQSRVLSQIPSITSFSAIHQKSNPEIKSQDEDWAAAVAQNYGIVCPKKSDEDETPLITVAQDYGIMVPTDEVSDTTVIADPAQNYGIVLCHKTVTDYSEIMPVHLANYGIVCPSDSNRINNNFRF